MRQTPALPPLLPMTPTAALEAWKVGLMAYELWTTSLTTIAMRHNLWYTKSPTSRSMMRENQRMVTEKLDASLEVAAEWQKAMLNMASGRFSPWWETGHRTLTPLHRRTTANSRRLSSRRNSRRG
ncbi:hypothetical protein [Modicisalibacter coralii]|uniref:hypothetical protein n=1 Tax=Modicisalibacter coralii TaxID=2304602 RepID=UPI00100A54EB|nr:hypothetical protein [Halomonas coralii]